MQKWTGPSTIDHRILILFRIDPEAVKSSLPPGNRPREIRGYALGGIALVRRGRMPAPLLPAYIGATEKAIHFISVEQTNKPSDHTDVVVTRWDTSSRILSLIRAPRRGLRRAHHARFQILQAVESIELVCDSDDHELHFAFKAQVASQLPKKSIFHSTGEAIGFLRRELRILGLAPRNGLTWRSQQNVRQMHVQPLQVEQIESSLFGGARYFPRGSAEFDSAFWIRDDVFAWNGAGAICCDVATA